MIPTNDFQGLILIFSGQSHPNLRDLLPLFFRSPIVPNQPAFSDGGVKGLVKRPMVTMQIVHISQLKSIFGVWYYCGKTRVNCMQFNIFILHVFRVSWEHWQALYSYGSIILSKLLKPQTEKNRSKFDKIEGKKKHHMYLPLAISFLPRKPKKGPWLASSSFFCLKYSWSSLATCLWNSRVTTFLSREADGGGGGGGGEGEEGEGEGGTGLGGRGGGAASLMGATGLRRGPSVWELLTVNKPGLVATENL